MMSIIVSLVMLITAIANNNDTYMIVSGLWAIAGAINGIDIKISEGDQND